MLVKVTHAEVIGLCQVYTLVCQTLGRKEKEGDGLNLSEIIDATTELCIEHHDLKKES
jgi:hypothetical protein